MLLYFVNFAIRLVLISYNFGYLQEEIEKRLAEILGPKTGWECKAYEKEGEAYKSWGLLAEIPSILR